MLKEPVKIGILKCRRFALMAEQVARQAEQLQDQTTKQVARQAEQLQDQTTEQSNNSITKLTQQPTSSNLNSSIQIYNGSMQMTKNSTRTIALFNRMIRLGLESNIHSYNSLIKAQLTSNNLQDALESLQLMPCKPTEETFQVILDRLTRHRSLAPIVRTTIQLAVHRYSIESTNSNLLFYLCLLHLSCNRLDHAIDSYRRLYSVIAKPGEEQMTRLLIATSGFVKSVPFFQILLHDLKRHSIFVSQHVLFRCLIGITGTNEVEGARELFAQVVHSPIDEGLLLRCLYLAYRTNHFQFALEIGKKMYSQGMDLSASHRALQLWLQSCNEGL